MDSQPDRPVHVSTYRGADASSLERRPFLSIITRTWRRPKALARLGESLAAQTSQDFEWIIIRDLSEEGMGIEAANGLFHKVRDVPTGDYILLLDDDDLLRDPDAVAHLVEATALLRRPVVLLFKADHGPHGILPTYEVWQTGRPVLGQVGGIDFIVAHKYWQAYVQYFQGGRGGDYRFLFELSRFYDLARLDRVLTAIQSIGHQRPEEDALTPSAPPVPGFPGFEESLFPTVMIVPEDLLAGCMDPKAPYTPAVPNHPGHVHGPGGEAP